MGARGLHLIGVAAVGVLLLCTASASATVTCNRVAAPNGSDSSAGTSAAPFKTAQKLVDSLSFGQTGCFRAGTFNGSYAISHPGITITSYPNERATLAGKMTVEPEADGLTVSNLNLDGRPGITSPEVSADNVTFEGNDVTNHHTAICFAIGNAFYRADNAVIENNNIHDCGRLPATNQDHGIYIAESNGTIVRNNWIHHNADFGVHMYPNADNTTITGNVIDSNGEGVIFAGDSATQTSDNNTVAHNIITNSQVRSNVESYFVGQPPGVGNTVDENCIKGAQGWYNGTDGAGIMSPHNGFTVGNNLIADPNYVDPGAGDYHLQSGSPCASILGGGAASGPQVTAPDVTAGSGSTTSATGPSGSNGSTYVSTSRKKPSRRHRARTKAQQRRS